MNEKELMLEIKRDPIKDLYILSSPFGYIEIPTIRIVQLPTSFLRKFETQKRISFRVLATAINRLLHVNPLWLIKNANKKN